ncbi:hypothetical protein KC930_01575 [Candidatus Saccharibacteria bacterium]|nr:hypothetical protein [Candidatus Saccharibacteria bacterium]
MNPQQPDFDFIMNPQKHKGAVGGGPSKKQRIMIFIGLVVIILAITIIIGSIISASANKSSNALVDLGAYQAELKRVIALGNDSVRDSKLHNNSLTASYTLESDYQTTMSLLKARGVNPPKDFATKYKGSSSDQAIENAKNANNVDAVYQQIYTEKLTNYKTKLSEVYSLLKPYEQAQIKQQSDHAKILLGETLATTTN